MPNIYVKGHVVQKLLSEQTDTQTHNRPFALPGPLKWSENSRSILHGRRRSVITRTLALPA